MGSSELVWCLSERKFWYPAWGSLKSLIVVIANARIDSLWIQGFVQGALCIMQKLPLKKNVVSNQFCIYSQYRHTLMQTRVQCTSMYSICHYQNTDTHEYTQIHVVSTLCSEKQNKWLRQTSVKYHTCSACTSVWLFILSGFQAIHLAFHWSLVIIFTQSFPIMSFSINKRTS